MTLARNFSSNIHMGKFLPIDRESAVEARTTKGRQKGHQKVSIRCEIDGFGTQRRIFWMPSFYNLELHSEILISNACKLLVFKFTKRNDPFSEI